MKTTGPELSGQGAVTATPNPGSQKDSEVKATTQPTKHPTNSIGGMLEKLKPELARALPAHITAERLTRIALTAIRTNPKLAECNPMSLMGAIMITAQLGLEPNTPLGLAYLIPYGKEATFQLGYKGLVDLANRSGQYKSIRAREVDQADSFNYEYGLDENLTHKPADKPTGNVTHYYAVYELTNGGRAFSVWSREKVAEHAKKYSKAYGSDTSPWKTDFNAMAKKTVIKDLLRYAPKSIELAQAVNYDNQVIKANMDSPDLDLDIDYQVMGAE